MKVKGSCQRKFAKDSGNANTTSLAFGSETGAQVYTGLEWSHIWETLPLHDPETKSPWDPKITFLKIKA